MSVKKPIVAIGLTATLLVGALVTMPSASAQVGQPIFTFDFSGIPTSAIAPIEDTANIRIDYTYDLKVAPQNLGGAQGTAVVTFTVNCLPNEVIISGATTDIIPLSASSTETRYTGSVTIQNTIKRTAAALDPITCTVVGTVSEVQAQGVPAPEPYTNRYDLKPDFFSLIEAKTDVKLRQGGPQKQIPFNIEMTNFGNGQTKVAFEVISAPEKGNWQGLIPDQAILDAPGGNKQTSTSVFTVATPYKNGWNNEEGAFTLALKPEYVFNPDKKGSEVTVTLLARVRGVYVPSLEPLIMVGVVVGAAMVARARNEE